MNRAHEQYKTLLTCLADGLRTSAELRRDLNDISPPTLSRLVERLSGKVVILGKARAAIYARPRYIRGCGHRFPVYRISDEFRTVCAQNVDKVNRMGEGPRLMTHYIC